MRQKQPRNLPAPYLTSIRLRARYFEGSDTLKFHQPLRFEIQKLR